MNKEPVKEDTGQNLSSYRQERDASVVIAALTVAFFLVDVDKGCIFKVLGDLSLL